MKFEKTVFKFDVRVKLFKLVFSNYAKQFKLRLNRLMIRYHAAKDVIFLLVEASFDR